MPDLIIEALKEEELVSFWTVFSSVLREGFPGYTPKVVDYFLSKVYSLKNFEHWLKDGWKYILVAKTNEASESNKIVGFAVIDKPYGGVSFCRWLGVLKECRRQGAGKKLVNIWVEKARLVGCHKVELASQPEAKKFYHACGLELEGKRNKSFFGIDQFVFGKVIGVPNEEVMIRD